MKQILVFLLFSLFYGEVLQAQIGLKIIQFRPTGNLGMVMDRKLVPELMYIDEFEDVGRIRASLATFKLEPRAPYFPTIGTIYDSEGFRVVPGVESYTKFHVTYFTVGMDWRIFRFLDDALSIYPGLDILAGYVDMEHSHLTPGISESDLRVGAMLGGLRPRAGIDQAITDSFGVFAEFTVSFYILGEVGKTSHHDIGLGARYIF